MKRIHRLSAAVCAAVLFCTAMPLTAWAETDAAYKTPSGLAFGAVKDAIEDYAENNKDKYTAFSAAVVSGEEVLYEGAFGQIDRNAGTPADADTCYEWGSISKTMVWVSVMQLWEQGRIDLEADIRTYLPEKFFRHLKYDDKITMLNLMNHNGGWAENFWALQSSDETAFVSLEKALRDTEPTQNTRPGAISSYCNWSAALAGYIVERISGETFGDYVHHHILEPLGMEHTAVMPAHEDNAWVKEQRKKVQCASQNALGRWKETGSQLNYIQLYPAGAVTGTIGDMAKFAQSFVQDPCPLFDKPETINEMLKPSVTLGESGIPGFCHGLIPELHGEKVFYGHNGAVGGFSSNFLFDLESGVAAVVMMIGSGDPTARIPEIVFGESELPEYEAKTPLTGDYSGIYYGLRAQWHGPVKWIYGLTGMAPFTKSGDNYTALGVANITPLGDGIGHFEQQGIKMFAAFSEQDGNKLLSIGGLAGYQTSTWITVCNIIAVLFVIIMLIGLLLLFIKLIQRIAKARKNYIGRGWITVSQLLRPIALALPILYMVLFYGSQYGFTRVQGYLLCGAEIIIMLVFAMTAVKSLLAMFNKERGEAGACKYFVNFIANGFSAFALAALELIRFWGI